MLDEGAPRSDDIVGQGDGVALLRGKVLREPVGEKDLVIAEFARDDAIERGSNARDHGIRCAALRGSFGDVGGEVGEDGALARRDRFERLHEDGVEKDARTDHLLHARFTRGSDGELEILELPRRLDCFGKGDGVEGTATEEEVGAVALFDHRLEAVAADEKGRGRDLLRFQ